MKPLTVKNGSAVAKIYSTPVRVNGKKYPAYLVRYYQGNRTIQKKFGALEGEKGAMAHAEEVVEAMNRGALDALLLNDADKQELLKAREILAGKATMIEAARFYVHQHPAEYQRKTVAEVIPDFLQRKIDDGKSKYWIKDLTVRLNRFAKKFGTMPLAELRGLDIDAALRSWKLSIKSRNNYRIVLSAFFNDCKNRALLPRDWNELRSIPVLDERGDDIEIYSPEEMGKLLRAAVNGDRCRDALPVLLFGGFAGLRTSEIARLDWSLVKPDHIEVKASRTKTAARRLAPLTETLRSWLPAIRPRRIWTTQAEWLHHDVIKDLEKQSGVQWKHNALRHSFISYRVASVKSTAQVAMECGTSERKIFTNYRELVTAEDASQWFKLFYKTVTKKPSPKTRKPTKPASKPPSR